MPSSLHERRHSAIGAYRLKEIMHRQHITPETDSAVIDFVISLRLAASADVLTPFLGAEPKVVMTVITFVKLHLSVAVL